MVDYLLPQYSAKKGKYLVTGSGYKYDAIKIRQISLGKMGR